MRRMISRSMGRRGEHRGGLGALLLIAAGIAGGCASSAPFDDWVSAPPTSTPAAAIEQPPRAGQAAALPEPATADDYVRLAMRRNPSIRAAEHEWQAARARIAQASSLDDPMLMVSPIGEMAQTASGEVGLMAGLSQRLPFPGKRGARGRIARARAEIAEASLRQVRLDVAAKVRRAYWSRRLARRLLGVIAENRALLSQLQQAADAAYRGGTADRQDVLRASLELSAIDADRLAVEEQAAAAAAQLNALMDRPVSASLPADAEQSPADLDLRLADLLARAERHNPELSIGRHRVEAARRGLDLARLQALPDLTVGVQYNQVMDQGLSPMHNGEDQWWLTFSINLPIWNGRQRAVRDEARHEVLAELASLHAAHNTLAADLQTRLMQVDTQRSLVALFEDTLTPQARQTLDVSLASYRAGRTDFANVAQAARKLLEFRRMQDQSETELEQRISELERLVGMSAGSSSDGEDAP